MDNHQLIDRILELAREKNGKISQIYIQLSEETSGTVSLRYIRETLEINGIKQLNKTGKKIKRIPKLDELIQQGKTQKEMAEKEGVTPGAIWQYILRTGQHKQWKQARRLGRIPERDILIQQGMPLKEIAEAEGKDHCNIARYIKKTGQYEQWRQARGLERIPERDILIQQGMPLKEIAEAEGKYKGTILHYIKKTGQHEQWKEVRRKESKPARALALKELGDVLSAVFLQKAKQEGWAYEQAARYRLSLKTHTREISFQRLVKLLTLYEEAKQKGEKVTLRELGKAANGRMQLARMALQKLGLPNFNPEYRLAPDKLQALERAFEVQHLSDGDIAYFVGTTWITVDKYFMGGRNVKDSPEQPSYKKASQIYEAIDAGFMEEEAAEYAEAAQKNVKRALKLRPEFEQKIIEALKIIYPDAEITKPYLPKGINSKASSQPV